MAVITPSHPFIKSVHGIRYQTKNVARAVAFYTQQLGFTVGHQQLPAFAAVSLGDVTILLSGPGASGSRAGANVGPYTSAASFMISWTRSRTASFTAF